MNNTERITRQWYARLRADGFEDIEIPWEGRDPSRWALRSSTPTRHGQLTAERLAEEQAYRSWAETVLQDTDWRGRRIERRIWEFHVEGLTYTEIAQKLKRSGVYRRQVFEVVNRIKAGTKAPQMGRPRIEGGRSSRTAWEFRRRLTDVEAEAVHALARERGCKPHEVLSELLSVLVRQKSGTAAHW